MGKNHAALAMALSSVVMTMSISASASAQSLHVALINVAPVIANLDGDSVTLPQGESVVALDADGNATLSDSDSVDFSGGNVTASFISGFQISEDALQVGNVGIISIAGSNVKVGATVIGVWLFDQDNATMSVFLNGNATPAIAQELLKALQYVNPQPIPFGVLRTVRVTVADGDGGVSEANDITISFETECIFGSGFEAGEAGCP